MGGMLGLAGPRSMAPRFGGGRWGVADEPCGDDDRTIQFFPTPPPGEEKGVSSTLPKPSHPLFWETSQGKLDHKRENATAFGDRSSYWFFDDPPPGGDPGEQPVSHSEQQPVTYPLQWGVGQ